MQYFLRRQRAPDWRSNRFSLRRTEPQLDLVFSFGIRAEDDYNERILPHREPRKLQLVEDINDGFLVVFFEIRLSKDDMVRVFPFPVGRAALYFHVHDVGLEVVVWAD